MTQPMRIDIISDAICPWCFIGKRHLEQAITHLAKDGLTFSIRWRPYQLNPDMPAGGVPRAEYRAAKFGSTARSRELDEGVAQAGRAAGLEFRHDLMRRTPNTINAHRLIRAAEAADRQDAVVEALFCAYFQQGQDIGDETVLAGIAQANGVVFDDSHRAEVLAEDAAFRRAGLSGVPSFLMEGYFLFSGAMPSEAMEDQFLKAHAALINKLT